jgi:hypothetical protein
MGVERGGERRWMGFVRNEEGKAKRGPNKRRRRKRDAMRNEKKRTKGKAKYGEMKPRKEDSRLP